MGSMAVRYNVTLVPAAAHGAFVCSVSMAERNWSERNVFDCSKKNKQTSDDSGLIPRKYPQLFSNLYHTATYPARRRHTGSLALVHVRNRYSEWSRNITSRRF